MTNLPPNIQEAVAREKRTRARGQTTALDQLREAAGGLGLPRPTADGDALLLPAEVRQRVRLSQPTIDRMRRKGTFPEPLIIGERRIAWKTSVIESWLAGRDHAGSKIRSEQTP